MRFSVTTLIPILAFAAGCSPGFFPITQSKAISCDRTANEAELQEALEEFANSHAMQFTYERSDRTSILAGDTMFTIEIKSDLGRIIIGPLGTDLQIMHTPPESADFRQLSQSDLDRFQYDLEQITSIVELVCQS